MTLFDYIVIQCPEVIPKKAKIHLAVWNGLHDPLDVYLAGEFEEWQSWQNRKNFERPYIISLIQLPGANRWLFAGGYQSNSSEWIEAENIYKYSTSPIKSLLEFSGKLIVSFKRSGRQSYLNAENWFNDIVVSELLPTKMVVKDFQGYNKCLISKNKLDIIVQQNIESWRGALSNVSGIYLITDTSTGKHYVGSATGQGGIWQRWCDYSYSGHGGNKDLVSIVKENGLKYTNNFQYAVLEIADTHTSKEDILQRESYWKNVLRSKEFGYNSN